MEKAAWPYILNDSKTPPPYYDPPVIYDADKMIEERDVMVRMRDGVRLCIDIYRPDTKKKVPVLLAVARHNKDMQSPETCEEAPATGPQPAWAPLWFGAQEAGDTRYLVARGYAHVIGNIRGHAKSEDGPPSETDHYDLIEWIAKLPWCDGNIGMIGPSDFARRQIEAAKQQPPHLKAIFPYSPSAAYWFRDFHPGGVISSFLYLLDQVEVAHEVKGVPKPLPPERERLWKEAMKNPDYKTYNLFYNLLTQKGNHTPKFFDFLIQPFESEEEIKKTEEGFKKIEVPIYIGAGLGALGGHLQGAQNYYDGIKNSPVKKLIFSGPPGDERPWRAFFGENMRWFDHWLKGKDTGILEEPRVKYWLQGVNEWRFADDWPLPETQWTKFYLQGWERLRDEPFAPSSRDSYEDPDAFVQMPPTLTREIAKLRYMTEPLPQDVTVVGPSTLHLYASIDQEDTNWLVTLKDVGPDSFIRSGAVGRTVFPPNMPERQVATGYLKASFRWMDPRKSKPYRPWRPLRKKDRKPVVPGEITEYVIEVASCANVFAKGHRICVEICSMDMPTGTAGFTNTELISYHICSSKITLHKIYRNEKYPSHILLPILPKGASK